MTDLSAKNRVQEYFQKNQLPLPKYSTHRVAGADHEPLFVSIIQLSNGPSIEGEKCANKKAAEMSAANKFLSIMMSTAINLSLMNISPINLSSIDIPTMNLSQMSLNGLYTPMPITKRVPDRTVLLVDVENMPNFIQEVTRSIENITIYAFIGQHHCLSNKIFPNCVIKILSPSTRADGTDTCMQMYIGYMLSRNMYDKYLIATRDHYGSAVVDMIKTDTLLWPMKDAQVVTQVSHI